METKNVSVKRKTVRSYEKFSFSLRNLWGKFSWKSLWGWGLDNSEDFSGTDWISGLILFDFDWVDFGNSPPSTPPPPKWATESTESGQSDPNHPQIHIQNTKSRDKSSPLTISQRKPVDDGEEIEWELRIFLMTTHIFYYLPCPVEFQFQVPIV